MTRTIKDAAYILQIIAGVDVRDNYTTAIPDAKIPNYTAACNLSALAGARIGVPRNVVSINSNDVATPEVMAFEQALEALRSAGAIIVEDTNFTAATEISSSNLRRRLHQADFIVNLESYLRSLVSNPNNIHSLADLRNFTQTSGLEDYPLRDTLTWDQALQAPWNNTDPEFWLSYQQYLYFGNGGGLLGAIDRHDLDAVVLPTNYAAEYAAPAGAPVVTVPMGSNPPGTPIVQNEWGLVQSAPNIP
jgi:amidase